MKDDSLRRMAKKRVEFRDHFMVYVIINAILFAINILTVPQFWWFLFPLVFWGIGVAFHWREAYHGDEDTRVEREYQKLKKAGVGKK
jgi:uncharacterized membrane protein YdbT with pleckstrin-like domain